MNLNPAIYLDVNATAPVLPQVRAALPEWLASPRNASSVHGYGRAARALLEIARKQVATACGAEGAQVVFTASGTEANNWVLQHAQGIEHIVVGATEHASILTPAQQKYATLVPVDDNGIINLEVLDKILTTLPGKALVSIQWANNETGVIQPIAEIVKIVLAHGGFTHTDASQMLGKMPLDFTAANVDFMTVSAHKCGGIAGAGALILKKGLKITPMLLGGGQEMSYRAGTENIPAITAFGMAASLTKPMMSELRDALETAIISENPQVVIAGKNALRLPNTSCIITPGMKSETQLINYDLAGVAVSAGSACSSGKVSGSHVLKAMGIEDSLAGCAIRVSTGHETTQKDIEAFLTVWRKINQKIHVIPAHAGILDKTPAFAGVTA